jgi:putative flavoprotein involved in K+ transport
VLLVIQQHTKNQGDKVADQPTGTRSSEGGDRERYDVIVIGGGQAGLAIGYYLKRQGLSFAILEAAEAVGAAWRGRWDSLVLFTPRRYSALPGLSFRGDPDGYPTRNEVITYLEEYARTFELPVHLDSRVRSLEQNERGYAVRVGDREIEADQVVVATGPFQVPRIPEQASGLAPDVFQAHSTAYIRPGEVPSGRLLVVGGGNTGYQIADELATARDVALAIGSRQTPLPQKLLGRDLFWWLTKTRLINKSVDTRIGQRARARDTLIGSSARRLRRHGIVLKPRVVAARGRTVEFADAVIWATGYRSDYSWIHPAVIGDDGRVRHRRGVTDTPGLYFLGLSWQHTRGSALIGWVKDDAEFIADRIAEHMKLSESSEATRVRGVPADIAAAAGRDALQYE